MGVGVGRCWRVKKNREKVVECYEKVALLELWTTAHLASSTCLKHFPLVSLPFSMTKSSSELQSYQYIHSLAFPGKNRSWMTQLGKPE